MSVEGVTNGFTAAPGGVPADDVSIEELEELSDQLNAAIKAYKDSNVGAGKGLAYRRKIAAASEALLNATRVAEELWNDQCVAVAEFAAIRCFMEWGAFEAIPFEGGISYKELANKIEAEYDLVVRSAGIMLSTGFLKLIGEDTLAHSRLSKVYAFNHPSGIFFKIMFDEAMLPWTHWNLYFQKHGRKEPKSSHHNPHTFAYDAEGSHFWDIIYTNNRRMADFMQSMNTLEQLLPITGMYDFSWLAEKAKDASLDPSRALIVDVGGGKGQALKAIWKENPDLDRKRFFLQDRPDVIKEAKGLNDPGLEGINMTVHDFYNAQPVKGAYIYYIRRCMHDFSDENCAKILSNLTAVMADDSRLLITEQIMTSPPSKLTAQTDLCMLNIGGKERSEKMWYDLAPMAGLRIVKIWREKGIESGVGGSDVGVIECVKA